LVLSIGLAARTGRGRTLIRALGKRAYRTVVGPAREGDDPVRAWKGTPSGERGRLRVMHVGDCSVRAMETSHDFAAPIGYPKAFGERLSEQGLGVEFGHYFAITYEYLPDIEKLEKVTKLSGAPDLILIHSGTTYQRRVILNSTRRINQLRLDVGRRCGRAIFFTHRFFVRPLVRRFGKHWNPYNGTGLLGDFIDRAEAAWPEAKIVVIAPFPNSWVYRTSGEIAAEVVADARALADRRGLPFLHFDELLGRDDSLRCANGYNLKWQASKMVGDELAEWVLGQFPERAATPHESDAHRRRHTQRRSVRSAS
jgi:hypothetical protein